MATKEEKKHLTFQEEWKEFYSGFSMHGIHFVFETNGVRRMFWFILVCASFVLSVLLFQGVISDFLQFKTVTLKEEIFGIGEVSFPTVTICNLNAISRKKLHKEHINETDMIRIYTQMKDHTLDLNDPKTKQTMETFREHNISSYSDFVHHFELSMEDLLYDPVVETVAPKPCIFHGNNCSAEDFLPVIARDTGLCEQFNSFHQNHMTNLRAKESGIGFGLHLYLNIHADDLLVNRVPFQGLAVFIHPYGTPFDSTRSHMVPVQPGTISFIHIKTSTFELLPSPYPSGCIKTKSYDIVTSSEYSKPMCEADCLMKEYKDACGCIPIDLSHHKDVRPVCEIKDFPCKSKLDALVQKNKRMCSTQCPLECNYTKYDISSEQTTISSKHTIKDIMNLPNWNLTYSETEQYIRNNIVGMDISFSDISFMKTTILPSVTWTGLLGSIGGNIGLCLGASLISFIEIFVFAVDMICKALFHRKKKSETSC